MVRGRRLRGPRLHLRPPPRPPGAGVRGRRRRGGAGDRHRPPAADLRPRALHARRAQRPGARQHHQPPQRLALRRAHQRSRRHDADARRRRRADRARSRDRVGRRRDRAGRLELVPVRGRRLGQPPPRRKASTSTSSPTATTTRRRSTRSSPSPAARPCCRAGCSATGGAATTATAPTATSSCSTASRRSACRSPSRCWTWTGTASTRCRSGTARAGPATAGSRSCSPTPRAFLAELHRRGLRVTLNVHPADGVRGLRGRLREHGRGARPRRLRRRADRVRHHRPRVPRRLPRDPPPPARGPGRRLLVARLAAGQLLAHPGHRPAVDAQPLPLPRLRPRRPPPADVLALRRPGQPPLPDRLLGRHAHLVGVAGLPARVHRDGVEHRLRLVEPRRRRPHPRHPRRRARHPLGAARPVLADPAPALLQQPVPGQGAVAVPRSRRAPRWATRCASATGSCPTCTP